jgi:hypothetical protein
MDRLARPDDELGGVERDPEDLRGAEADRFQGAAHAVIAHEDQDGAVRLDHLSDPPLEPAVSGGLVQDSQVAARGAHIGDLHFPWDGADMCERQRDHTRQGWPHHQCDLQWRAILNNSHDWSPLLDSLDGP